MHAGRLRSRTPSAQIIEAARLVDHELRFNKRSRDGSGKCNVVRRDDSEVYGVVYRIARQQKSVLDRVEGFGYFRQARTVRGLLTGRSYSAFLYVAKAVSLDDTLQPYDWYRDLVISGAELNGLPPEYVEFLRQVQARADPKRRRHAFNIMQSQSRS